MNAPRFSEFDSRTWQQQSQALANSPLVQGLLDALPSFVLVLNDRGQLVTANAALFELLAIEPANVLGRRPGEVLGCVRARDTSCCGAARFCNHCGIASAVARSSSGGQAASEECRLHRTSNKSSCMDLRVRATPLPIDDQVFTVCILEDIGVERHRRALESVFFHDVRNTVSAVLSCASLLKDLVPGPEADIADDLYGLAHRLHQEIRSQKLLLEAEAGELQLSTTIVSSATMLTQVRRACQSLQSAQLRTIRVVQQHEDISLPTDPTLLRRVVSNMVTNALEATDEGGEIRVGCSHRNHGVEFWVWNAAAITPDVASHVFQRSFSTKATGRGLGTYGMKLLTERYLGGRVYFTSSVEEGTTFRAWLPAMS